MSFHRDWGPPEPPIKTLCPIDRSKEAEGESEDASGDNGKKRRRHDGAANNHNNQPPMAHAVSVNGRRVLLCNFNGIIFQVSRCCEAIEN